MARSPSIILCVIPLLLGAAHAAEHVVPGDFDTIQAAKSGYLDLARIYVERGVDVNAVETESGKTALDYAAEGNHRAIAQLLREHGAE